MPSSTRPSPPSSNLVDANYRFLVGIKDDISTLDLFAADPEGYAKYLAWYESRQDFRRVFSLNATIESRLAAYLRLVAARGQRFCLGVNAIPSSKWLRERLDIHRNTMAKYVKDAQTTRRVQLSLNTASRMAFAAAIYPPPTKLEKNAVASVWDNRLDLIDDYHLTGKNKRDMVRYLAPITRSGTNDLFTIPKNYPCSYDLDPKGQPMKRISAHTARRAKK
ncbi:hypothetical protein [Rubripirellula reticaptiva]|uniref:Uncharacterized protein n=1 Tax=Rubripirellula reticaptiva TaxID=2528013 RepID=A0A5C6ER90_9BACT|nr:hypothetical protein [Rubripirellula reticaptiva]TWU51145.1 hypothetical protein Poly59_27350 [Rubripirellula reticaptiva]